MGQLTEQYGKPTVKPPVSTVAQIEELRVASFEVRTIFNTQSGIAVILALLALANYSKQTMEVTFLTTLAFLGYATISYIVGKFVGAFGKCVAIMTENSTKG